LKLLLHICCAPCAIYPLKTLDDAGIDVMGFFYRHNIHPYTECLRRQETLADYAGRIGLRVIYQKGYELESFLRNVVYREADRCRHCYYDRLRSAALVAKKGRFDAFSSTLLYSRFQRHELIRSIGTSVSRDTGVPFYYEDWRIGWKYGVDTSRSLGMYRQQYCGCIYSEKERFYRDVR